MEGNNVKPLVLSSVLCHTHIPNFCENSHIWMFVKIELLPIRCLFLKVK